MLSERTESYDLIEKRAAYRSLASLQTYTIVHTTSRRIEIDSRASDGSFSTTILEEGAFGIGATNVFIEEVYAQTTTL